MRARWLLITSAILLLPTAEARHGSDCTPGLSGVDVDGASAAGQPAHQYLVTAGLSNSCPADGGAFTRSPADQYAGGGAMFRVGNEMGSNWQDMPYKTSNQFCATAFHENWVQDASLPSGGYWERVTSPQRCTTYTSPAAPPTASAGPPPPPTTSSTSSSSTSSTSATTSSASTTTPPTGGGTASKSWRDHFCDWGRWLLAILFLVAGGVSLLRASVAASKRHALLAAAGFALLALLFATTLPCDFVHQM